MAQPTIDIYAPIPFKSKQLSQSKTTTTFSSTAPFTPSYVISSLTQSSDPTSLYNARVKGRQILLENPARESRLKKEEVRKGEVRRRERERRARMGGSGMGGKGRREERGLWKAGNLKFASLVPLHHLWLGYMSELLNLPQPPTSSIRPSTLAKMAPPSSSMHPKLLKADFHGALLKVKNAKNPCLVGLEGIVVHETENAFKVVTEKNAVKLIPKQNSIFTFSVPLFSTLPPGFRPGMPYPVPQLDTTQPTATTTSTNDPSNTPSASNNTSITSNNADPPPSDQPSFVPSPTQTVSSVPNLSFELYGNQFRFRSTDRAGRKFKHKETIEL
ncbi:hypothetical protein CC1G_08065 [Coprinopsis cinerea okayama7|uniref:Uncharacterized protein n=1 Tax=Coprinopsis cinerea (strain Okayama-7 / 130 / ATCC MYA-4618 / FGSC 9003) TaxID=240176 RepID=A8NVL6_COPC7|nr:hypothetical protein CC1G_08065 [Coprinopsis cinerea okayama7\|eukprot:XP_001836680.2 hypothetical protein CC1G_08065 [Coprinopsis cinerea okayama7\